MLTDNLSRTVSKLSQIIFFKFWTFCVFEPPYGGLEVTYTVHLRLTGKLVVEFLFVLIELFAISVTAEAL